MAGAGAEAVVFDADPWAAVAGAGAGVDEAAGVADAEPAGDWAGEGVLTAALCTGVAGGVAEDALAVEAEGAVAAGGVDTAALGGDDRGEAGVLVEEALVMPLINRMTSTAPARATTAACRIRRVAIAPMPMPVVMLIVGPAPAPANAHSLPAIKVPPCSRQSLAVPLSVRQNGQRGVNSRSILAAVRGGAQQESPCSQR